MNELEDLRVEIDHRFQEWEEQLTREGLQKGEAHLLLRQLRKRFGELPDAVTARVNSAPALLT